MGISYQVHWMYRGLGRPDSVKIRRHQPYLIYRVFRHGVHSSTRSVFSGLNWPLADLHSRNNPNGDSAYNTDSETIIEALGEVGKRYQSPKKIESRRRAAVNSRGLNLAGYGRKPLTPKELLTRHLKEVRPYLSTDRSSTAEEADRAFNRVYSPRNIKWLSVRQWNFTDVFSWEWVLTASDGERAAFRLQSLQRSLTSRSGYSNIPQFLLLLLLRRQDISALGLRALLRYTWHYMEELQYTRQSNSKSFKKSLSIPNPKDDVVGMHGFMFMIVVIRLIRAAQRVWPAALVNIAYLFSRYMDGVHFESRSDSLRSKHIRVDLTMRYNKILKLLAIPTSLYPVMSSVFQRQAQFVVLDRMTKFDISLPVTHEGFQAAAWAQLSSRKTERESKWAALKAPSWPPWKEEKLGIDADVGPEYGEGPVIEILRQAKAAGHAPDVTDDTSSILSGWDVDGSPTIQARQVVSNTKMRKTFGTSSDDIHSLWSARILATRNVVEAWAAFLASRGEVASTPRSHSHFKPYQAMLKKIILADSCLEDRGQEPRPTDIGRPPPDLDAFYHEMVEDGVRPNLSMLCSFVSHAATVPDAIKYSRNADLPVDEIITILRSENFPSKNPSFNEAISRLESPMIESLVEFFLRHEKLKKLGIENVEGSPVLLAIKLACASSTSNRKIWSKLIQSISKSWEPVILPGYRNRPKRDITSCMNWRSSLTLLRYMRNLKISPDLDIFYKLCLTYTRAVFEVARLSHRFQGIDDAPLHAQSWAHSIILRGTQTLKRLFAEVTSPRYTPIHLGELIPQEAPELKPSIPQLLETPNFAHIHAFIRVLGLLQDYPALIELSQFMASHSSAISSWSAEFREAEKSRDKMMTALRVYVEQSWIPMSISLDVTMRPELLALDREMRLVRTAQGTFFDGEREVAKDKIRHIIASSEIQAWGGWPIDEQVEAYLAQERLIAHPDDAYRQDAHEK